MDFVPCCKWLAQGTVVGKPERIQLSREELQQIITESKEENNSDDDYVSDEDEQDRYNMETYDDDVENDNNALAIGSLINNDDIIEDEEDSDDEDEEIKPDDNLIIVGKGFRDNSGSESIEIHVHNDAANENYVHHDIMLPACPLALEIITVQADDRIANLIAAGLMNASIELYDINVINPVKPQAKLGSKKKDPNKGHADAVLDLSWNKQYSHILASSSADKTVILWDLEAIKMSDKLDYFSGNVENIEWDDEGHCLLCCDSTGSVKLVDCRDYQTANELSVKGEALIARFSNIDSNQFYIGTNKGRIICFDKRSTEPLFKLKAHESDVTGIASIPGYSGLLVSTCVGGDMKLWDINTSPQRCVFNKSLNAEQLHCLDLNPDNPLIAALGGANKKGPLFTILNLNKKDSIKELLDFRKIQL